MLVFIIFFFDILPGITMANVDYNIASCVLVDESRSVYQNIFMENRVGKGWRIYNMGGYII